ncbi:MAG: hypothetical protein HY565_05405 [Candidatus Kerfeldbacteria bacterium]|nr:hypothetical protein [Candidatus Kerfeldbacteria bacterium]
MNKIQPITVSECPACSGTEIPTGKMERREQGKEYYQFTCTECHSTGWEWKQQWQTELLSQRMVVPLFMTCGFVGGLALVMASAFIPGVLGHGSWSALVVFGVVGVLVIMLGLRPRVVQWFPVTRIVQVGWGKRWTWVYKTIQPQQWASFSVEKVLPVGVTPVGSVMRTTALPPYWKLVGTTKTGKHIWLAQYPSAEAAAVAHKQFAGYLTTMVD